MRPIRMSLSAARVVATALSAAFVSGLAAGCATDARLGDAEVRMTDRPECRNARGIPAGAESGLARDPGIAADCYRQERLEWKFGEERESMPVDFRRKGDGE